MAIYSGAGTGLIRERAVSATGAGIRWQNIPLQAKVVIVMLLSLMLLVLSILSAARTETVPDIHVLDEIYLPGNVLPQLPKDAECFDLAYLYRSCLISVLGQKIYLNYEPSSRMMVHTGYRTKEYSIGELIVAWGFPTGIAQHDTFTFVNWERRSAIIYSKSFEPESRVAFIQYDLEEQPSSVWEGFRTFEKRANKED